MNQAIANAPLTSHWNMSSLLHLIVLDHSESDATLAVQELRRAGFHCDSAFLQSRQDFLATLSKFPCDLVLASHRLPDWSGLDAFSALRRAGYEIPFLLVTEPMGEEAAVECLKLGVTDYVLKENLSRLPVAAARALDEKSVRDAHKFMVDALHQSESNSLLLFAHNPLPMWVVDRSTLQILAVNDSAIQHYGFDRMEFLEMRFSEFHPADELPRLLEDFQKDSRTPEPSAAWHHRRKNGTLMDVEIFRQRMEFSGMAASLIVAQDISERRALEKQLQRAQKFEAIGQLAGGIAHDVNNVMGAILGWAELGEDQAAADTDPILKYFQRIHTQCDRVTELIRRLLAFARRQILEPRQLSLNQSVREVLALLDKVIGKDVEIKTQLTEDLSIVRADPTQIEQVLMNLCLNSRDAMPQGGTLTISTRNLSLSEQDCRSLPGAPPGKYAELCVKDTGMGMSQAVRDHLFEPFFTTKEPGQGTGLGLATVFGIVKQHGGYIHVESEAGLGAAFRILLPVQQAGAGNDSLSTVVNDQPVRGGTETILIAEDHEGIREMAQAALRSQGYRTLLACDGDEAVATFSAHRDEISLVLLDVIMPRSGGAATYSAIREINPNIAVIFATGYSNETAGMAELVKDGAAILRKPFSPKTLCRRVRELLDQAARSASAMAPHA